MAHTMLAGMLLMTLACWMYTIAVALARVRWHPARARRATADQREPEPIMLNLLLSSPHLGYVAGAFGVAFAALGLGNAAAGAARDGPRSGWRLATHPRA